MSQKKDGDRSALIVLGLLVGAIVVVSFLGLLSRHEAGRQVRCYVEASAQSVVEPGATFCPDDHIFFGDGAAQWVMAFFTVAATLVSGIALYWLRQTFKETKRTADAAIEAAKAANRTNQIAIAERRPWVTLRREIECDFLLREFDQDSTGHEYFKYQTHLTWWHSIENVGQTPAFGTKLTQKVIAAKSYLDAVRQLRAFADDIDLPSATVTEWTIFPGEQTGPRRAELYTSIFHADAAGDSMFLLVAITYRSQESDILGMEAGIYGIDAEAGLLGPKISRLLEYVEVRITR